MSQRWRHIFRSSITLRVAVACLSLSIVSGFWLPGSAPGQIAENVEIPCSFNPVGSGARALGMGGAFIAVADDATSASWNPGGLIQLERPEISVVGAFFSRTEDLHFMKFGDTNGQSVSGAGLNYLSAAYPFTIASYNMIVSINYQHLYDFERQWHLDISESSDERLRRSVEQDGGLYAYGLAYCVQILPELSFGFTLNLWEDGIYSNGWEQTVHEIYTYRPSSGKADRYDFNRKDRFSFSGFNANVGFLWSMTSNLTVGAVFKTPFTADLSHHVQLTASSNKQRPQVDSATFDEELYMPMSYGMGFAYRFSDHWTVSGDVYRTEWEDFVLTCSDGRKISPISGLNAKESDVGATTQVRLGTEYLIIKPKYIIPLRAGAFYDPAPAEGSPDSYFGLSLGSGIGIGPFIFDIAYQYRFGSDVGSSTFSPQAHFSEDLGEHTVYSSIIVHF